MAVRKQPGGTAAPPPRGGTVTTQPVAETKPVPRARPAQPPQPGASANIGDAITGLRRQLGGPYMGGQPPFMQPPGGGPPGVPAWQQLANAGIQGQGSAAANRAAASQLPQPRGNMNGVNGNYFDQQGNLIGHDNMARLPAGSVPPNLADFFRGAQGLGQQQWQPPGGVRQWEPPMQINPQAEAAIRQRLQGAAPGSNPWEAIATPQQFGQPGGPKPLFGGPGGAPGGTAAPGVPPGRQGFNQRFGDLMSRYTGRG